MGNNATYAQNIVTLQDCGVSYIDPQDQSNLASQGRDTLVYQTFFGTDAQLRAFYVDINAFGGQQIDRTTVFAILPDGSEQKIGELAFGNCLDCRNGFAFVFNDSLYVENEKDLSIIRLWLQSFGQPDFALSGSLQTLVGAGRISGHIPFCAIGMKVLYIVNSNPNNATTEFSTHIVCPEVIQDCSIQPVLEINCAADSFTLSATIPQLCFSPNAKVSWVTPTGETFNQTKIQRKLTGNEGRYYLMVEDEYCLLTDSILVENPSFANAGNDMNLCAGNRLQIIGSGGLRHFWELPDGNIFNEGTYTVEVSQLEMTGTYILHAFDEKDCKDQDTIQVLIKEPESPDVIINSPCIGDTLLFLVSNQSNFLDLSWYSPSGQKLSLNFIPDFNTDNFGNYTLISKDADGCERETMFSVSGSLPPSFEYVIEESCDSTRVFLFPDEYTYTWETGEQKNVFATSRGGNYLITVTDKSGCSIGQSLVLPPPEGPGFDLKIEQPFCPGDFGKVEIIPQNPNRPAIFSIDGGLSYSLSPKFKDLNPGLYAAAVQDELGCTKITRVVIERPDTMGVTLDLDTLTVHPGTLVNLTAKTIGNIASIQWLPKEIDSGELNTAFYAENNLDVRIVVKDEKGCHASDGFQLTVILSPVFAPNAFSPNNDGLNDGFTLYSDELSGEIIEKLQVFDRYGNLVFSTTDIPLNDPALGWNGKAGSRVMGTGVYTYLGMVKYGNGERKLMKGDVILMR